MAGPGRYGVLRMSSVRRGMYQRPDNAIACALGATANQRLAALAT